MLTLSSPNLLNDHLAAYNVIFIQSIIFSAASVLPGSIGSSEVNNFLDSLLWSKYRDLGFRSEFQKTETSDLCDLR